MRHVSIDTKVPVSRYGLLHPGHDCVAAGFPGSRYCNYGGIVMFLTNAPITAAASFLSLQMTGWAVSQTDA